MADIRFKFDEERTAEAMIYLAERISSPTIMAIAKLLYFVDKTSLEKFGRSLTGDAYFAMQHGPVPSNAYDMLKAARDSDVYGFVVEANNVITLRQPNLDKLSISDRICLDQIIAIYGHFPVWQLRELSHDEAWKKTWKSAGTSKSVPIPIAEIVAMLDDEEAIMEYIQETHKPLRDVQGSR